MSRLLKIFLIVSVIVNFVLVGYLLFLYILHRPG